jgi:hypothetical protein
MQAHRLILPVALLVPTLLGSHLPADRVRFAPSEGSSVTKTFVNKAELTLQSMNVTMNGQDLPTKPEMEMTINSDQKVVVTDQYVANRDGAPKKLKRSFDELGNTVSVAMKMAMMGQSQNKDQNMTGESELQGKKVVFTWDDDKGAYSKAFDPALDKDGLLKDLEEDMDLRVLLPTHEVKTGDSWDIDDVKTLASVLAPGGNLSILPKDMSSDDMAMSGMPGMGSMGDWLRGSLEGSAKATFTGVSEVDGAKVAKIKIEAKITVSKDMTDLVQEAMKKAKLPPEAQNMSFDHMDIDYKLEADGELQWDLGAGRMHSFEMTGPSKVNMDMAMKIEAQGQKMNIGYTMELAGTTSLKVEAK